ncbi:MAG: homoserine O-acetyltransferase [Candidatus Margulisiibacteriota bacterium]
MVVPGIGTVGVVSTRHFHSQEDLILESGEKLGPITITYETYGQLGYKKENAILIEHAFTGDAHAAGLHTGDNKPGWWNNLIGPGKAFDTNKYFIICSNVLGGCRGSTGPSSIDPKSGKPYALNFPTITITDIVRAQKLLLDHLGIKTLLSVAGGSMGGMQALQWAVSYPDKVRSTIPIAAAAKNLPQQIAFNEVGRQAIMADPNWNDGNYYDRTRPEKGLSVARMIGHITYMSDKSMEEKFGRRFRETKQAFKFGGDFEVESYLQYRGNKFVKRFDANSYLYLTKAMDHFDLSGGRPLFEALKEIKAKFLVIAFKSDLLYPAYHSEEIVRACKLAGIETTYCEINSHFGHDAFLLETEEESRLIKHFLERVYTEDEENYEI